MIRIDDLPRRSWLTAEPRRASAERAAMAAVASELVWDETSSSGGWRGLAPVWPFDRPAPPTLEVFLAGRRLTLRVDYPQAFPLAEPVLRPLDPEPELLTRTQHRWHVNGNGSLCLLQRADDWTGEEHAAELVRKAAGWFLEFLLMQARVVGGMTEAGLAEDDSRDRLLVPEHP
jgi:hypothetical protein